MKQIIIIIINVLICARPYSQNVPAAELLNPDCMEAGSASIMVYDLNSDKEVFSFDAERALPTASIQKLMTTAAAIHSRGDSFRYKTKIGYTGSISNGELTGDLVIIGSGDPTMGSRYFDDTWSINRIRDSLIAYLSNLGVERIAGDIVIDVSSAPGQHVPGGWPWSDLGNYYGAGHWALNIHDNEYKIFFRQNQAPGRMTRILRTVPELYPFVLTNEVRTGPSGSGDRAYIYAAPYSKGASVRGTIPPGAGSFSIRGSLTNPPIFFGKQLAAGLIQSSIDVEGQVKPSFSSVENVHTLFSILSPTLRDIIRVTNFRSVNLYAEGLLKLLCDDVNVTSQFECGLRTLTSFWEDQGVEEPFYFFKDGSGLSPRNSASSRSFVEALRAIYKNESWYKVFLPSLPEMGEEGTLRYMLRGYNGSGRIHAKSGYIGRQRSYAGYITTESGRDLAFCVILDNYNCSSTRMRQRIEKFLITYLRS